MHGKGELTMVNCMECIHIDVCIKAATSHIDHCNDYSFAGNTVEVVRCRDCKYWKPTGSKAGNSFSDMEYIGGCEFTKYCRLESDFCSYGKRKEGAD